MQLRERPPDVEFVARSLTDNPDVPSFRARRSRYSPPARRGPLRLAAVIALAITVALAIGLAIRIRSISDEVTAARNELLEGARVLQAGGLTLSRQEAVVAGSDFEKAEARFSHAHGALTNDPVIRLVGIVPGVHRQLAAATELTDMGTHLAHSGTLAIQVIDVLLAEDEVGPGAAHKPPGERLIAVLRALDPRMNAIVSDLNAVKEDRRRIPFAGLLPQLSNAVSQMDNKFPVVDQGLHTLQAIEPGLYKLLGTDGRHSYLVLQQDPAELRATGGFIGSVGFLTFDRGKMSPYEPHDVYDIDHPANGNVLGGFGDPKYVPPPAPLDRFIHPSSWELRDANWSPDFPTSAQQAEFLYTRESGRKVDGVIAIDPLLIARILSVVGPVQVPETGDTVTAANFYEKTLLRVQLHTGPGARKSFLSYAAKPILERLFALPTRQLLPLLQSMERACGTKSLQAYFADPAIEGLVEHFNCTGRVKPWAADGLMIVDSNLDGNKDDFWVKRDFSLKIAIHSDGIARHTLHLHYGSYPRIVNVTGPYIGWLRVYLPVSSTVVSVDGASLRPADDLGRRVMQGWIQWMYQASEDVTIVYDVDAPAVYSSAHWLSLYWQKQAGREADPIKLQVVLPAGWRILRAQVGSTSVSGNAAKTDLSVDRDFQFWYQPS